LKTDEVISEEEFLELKKRILLQHEKELNSQ